MTGKRSFISLLLVVLVASILLAGCGGKPAVTTSSPVATPPQTTTPTTIPTTTTSSTTSAAPVSFKQEILPMLVSKCQFCHSAGVLMGGLNLDDAVAYANLVNAGSQQSPLKLVLPGDPDKSYLVAKLTNTQAQAGGSGARMPSIALPEDSIGLFRQWIAQGAANN